MNDFHITMKLTDAIKGVVLITQFCLSIYDMRKKTNA